MFEIQVVVRRRNMLHCDIAVLLIADSSIFYHKLPREIDTLVLSVST